MYDVFRSMNVVLIIANSEDPDEMQHKVCQSTGLGGSHIQSYVPSKYVIY